MSSRNGQVPPGQQSNDNPGAFAKAPAAPEATFTLGGPGSEPVGYSFRGRRLNGAELVELLIGEGAVPPESRDVPVEQLLDDMAQLMGVRRSNEFRFNEALFPKRITAERVTCADVWAGEAKPPHRSNMATPVAHCADCGVEVPQPEKKATPPRRQPTPHTRLQEMQAKTLAALEKAADEHNALVVLEAAEWVTDQSRFPNASAIIVDWSHDGFLEVHTVLDQDGEPLVQRYSSAMRPLDEILSNLNDAGRYAENGRIDINAALAP